MQEIMRSRVSLDKALCHLEPGQRYELLKKFARVLRHSLLAYFAVKK